MSEGELKNRINEKFKDFHGEEKRFWTLSYAEVMKLLDEAIKEYPFGFSAKVSWKEKDEWAKKWLGKRKVQSVVRTKLNRG